MERGSRTKLVAGLVLAAVFASGLLVGFAADNSIPGESSVATPDPRSDREGRTEDGTRERRRRPLVYEQLNPTPDQNAVIDSILRVHRTRMNELDKEYRAVRHEYNANYDAVIQDTRDAIAAVFPPDVATEYRRLLAEFDRRREAERAAERDRRE